MEKVSKKDAQKWLADVPAAYTFKCSDGCEIKNMPELAKALESMRADVFRFHSEDKRSDFGIWIADIIGDSELASELMTSRTREQAAEAVSTRVAQLVKKAAKVRVS